MTLRTLNYGNYGIFLITGNAGFCPSAVLPIVSIVVPFFGETKYIIRILQGNPKEELQLPHRVATLNIASCAPFSLF